jgi:hypothetical protein
MSELIRTALTREAASAAQHLGFAASIVHKANCMQHAYYSQMLFSLSIGLERACKLAIALDYALKNDRKFPHSAYFMKKGHHISDLFEEVETIARAFEISKLAQLIRTDIHDAILKEASDFGKNITRYYNFDILADPPSGYEADPVSRWFTNVTGKVLCKHYTCYQADKHGFEIQQMSKIFQNGAVLDVAREDGTKINSIGDFHLHGRWTDYAAPYTRMYILQLVRFLGAVLGQLGNKASPVLPVPYFSEIFSIFCNKDSYFKKRKTWIPDPRLC